MRAPAWTEAELGRAEALVAEGLTYARIADRLGRSHTAVRGAMSRFGRRTAGKCRAFTMAEIRRAQAMRAEGLSYAEIGRALGRSGRVVRGRLVAMGAPTARQRAWTAADDDELLRLCAQGLSQGQIGAALGRSKGSVAGRLLRLAAEGRRSAQTRAARPGNSGKCRHAATAGGETPGTRSDDGGILSVAIRPGAVALDPGSAAGAGALPVPAFSSECWGVR